MDAKKLNKELEEKEKNLNGLVNLLKEEEVKIDKIKNMIMANSGQLALIKKWIEEEKEESKKTEEKPKKEEKGKK